MQIYLAPLQGLTDWIFRESYSEIIGKFDKTFTPFIRVQNGEFYRPSQCNDLLPEHNQFQQPIPQFLGNDAASFKRFEEICLENNYSEININMGCPYPMVTGKKMGAGLLAYPQLISELLENIFAETRLKISVKCRLGMESPSEFEAIIPIFNAFPLEEIILHPRIGKQQYKGDVNLDAFARYSMQLKHPICYNGDISDVSHLENIISGTTTDRIMIGRGILKHPFLLAKIRNEDISASDKVKKLRNFHISIIENCKKKYSGDAHFLKRLEEMWSFHAEFFEDGHKIYKMVKKCKTLAQYEGVIFKAINEMEIYS